MLKEMNENFEITEICVENHASATAKVVFLIKMLLTAAVAVTTFKIYG